MKSYRLEAREVGGRTINRGTAWAIDRDLIATAFHVVSDEAKERWLHELADVSYWLICDDAITEIELESVNCDSSADVAVLRVLPPLNDAKRPSLQSLHVCEWGAAVGSYWSAPSYPALAGAASVTLTGTIKGVRLEGGSDVFELLVSEGGDVSWVGASGSPVISDGRVIGLILTELPGAATQDAVSVQPALSLSRLAQSAEIRNGFHDLVANSGIAQLKTLAALLPQAAGIEDSVALAEFITTHAFSYGVRGMLDILEQLPDTQEKRTYALSLVKLAFDNERGDWPCTALRDNRNWDRHADHPIPQSLEDAWTLFTHLECWHESLRQMVQKLLSSLETVKLRRGLFLRLERLDLLAPFQVLCDELADLITDIEEDIGSSDNQQLESNTRDATTRIRLHIHPTTPRGTCFFLMGSSGSGKTHFLEWLIRQQNATELVLPVAWPKMVVPTVSSLEGEILVALRKATGRSFETLAQFQEALDRFENARAHIYHKYSLGNLPQRSKVVITFDNMQNVLSDVRSSGAACVAMQELINDATRYHSVRWVVTLQDTFFDRLAMPVEPPSFWEEYGFIGSAERASSGAVTVSAKGGWIDLDRICVHDGVGQAILAQSFGDNWSVAVALDDDIGPAHLRTGALRRYMALPWFAWILVSLGENWCINALHSGDLNHISIVDELHMKKVLPLGDSEASRMELGRYLRAIAAAMLPGDGSRLDDHDFSGDSEMRCTEAKILFVADHFRDALGRFITSGLLKRHDGYQVRLDVEFVMLWGYEAAKYLKLVLTGQDSATIATRLCADLARAEDDLLMLKESTLEFLLMLADRQNAHEIIDTILTLAVHELGSNAAAILFAAPKLSSSIQQHIAHFNVQSRAAVGATGPDRRLLLAAMMFAEWADPAAFTPSERLDFVRAHYRSIGEFGFSSYYRAVAIEILDEVTDLDTLRACMVSLNRCEQAGLAKDLATLVVERMFNIGWWRGASDEENSAVIQTVLRYAAESFETAKEDYRQRQAPTSDKRVLSEPRSGPRSSWRREFFREWVLHEVCTRLVEELAPVPAFKILEHYGWFNVGGRGDLHIEMEREATLAMGHYFHGAPHLLRAPKGGAGRDFISLVNNLAALRTEQRMLAFNMIVHTKPTSGLYNQKLSQEFIPLLETLANDPKVAQKKRFRGVYKSTVGKELRIAHNQPKFRKGK